jgi:oxygen-independent coproporphyrinogen-3 oxidase
MMEDFLRALKREIELFPTDGKGEKFETIFFGGGTPSLLSPVAVDEILRLLSRKFDVAPDAEITLEANPGTVNEEKLAGYRSAGVNRISFGVQSFHDDELKFLTRIHTASAAVEAIGLAKKAQFENINLDLIFALPHQTMAGWKDNLRRAVELEPQHISAYSLIVEQNTPLARMVKAKQVSPLPTSAEAGMYRFTMEYLRDTGFEHYEVSSYARPHRSSRHNSNYWNHTNYFGFGPSAHSFHSMKRWWNIANNRNYCEMISAGRLPVAGEERLSNEQLLEERIMLGLRSRGVDLRQVFNDFGVDVLAPPRPAIRDLIESGLAILDDTILRLTDKGFMLCDEITVRLLANLSPA